ncbi:MAG: hypothetical protein ACREL5_11335 [Gemmatimonadales bacterium]
MPLPPRILIISDDQWPRALLRAALIDAGHDAIGARTIDEALEYPPNEPERGPVGLIVLDHSAMRHDGAELQRLLDRHRVPPVLLLASAVAEPPPGPWARIARRPVTIGDAIAAATDLLCLVRRD